MTLEEKIKSFFDHEFCDDQEMISILASLATLKPEVVVQLVELGFNKKKEEDPEAVEEVLKSVADGFSQFADEYDFNLRDLMNTDRLKISEGEDNE